MRSAMTFLVFLIGTSTAHANCPKERLDLFDALRIDSKVSSARSKELYAVADYLSAKLNDRKSPYYDNQIVASLMLDARTEGLRYLNESARLQIQATNTLVSCIKR